MPNNKMCFSLKDKMESAQASKNTATIFDLTKKSYGLKVPEFWFFET